MGMVPTFEWPLNTLQFLIHLYLLGYFLTQPMDPEKKNELYFPY